jgi:hypothetical protein
LELVVRVGQPLRGEVFGAHDALDRVRLSDEGGCLLVDVVGEPQSSSRLVVELWTPRLESLHAGDAAHIRVLGLTEGLHLQLDDVCHASLSGRLTELELLGRGGSQMDAGTCPADKVQVTLSGTARARVNAHQSLLAHCGGASQLEVCGTSLDQHIDCSGAALVLHEKRAARPEAVQDGRPEPLPRIAVPELIRNDRDRS